MSQHDGSRTVPSRRTRSSGGVVYRRSPEDGEHEVALIATRGGTRWQLPKGTQEPGESSEETALREVLEETGLLTEATTFLDAINFSYWDTYRKRRPVRVRKTVDFYLMRVTGAWPSEAVLLGGFAIGAATSWLGWQAGKRPVVTGAGAPASA